MNPHCIRITILQSCDIPYTPLLDTTAATNRAYATAHDYTYRQHVGNLSPIPNTANFNRYYLLRQEIDSGTHDWALWLDADAIVVNHATSLESIIDRTPDKMLIACRGGCGGEQDINNGVFLLALRHPLASEMVEALISHCEQLDPRDSSFKDDQYVMHTWLRSRANEHGAIEILKCYTDGEYNLFNYDGCFIKHVLREHGALAERVGELRRLAGPITVDPGPCVKLDHGLSYPGHDSWTRPPGTPPSFQAEHKILVASPAAYDHPPLSSRWLIESARRRGIELTFLGQGQAYPNHRRKIGLVAEYLRQHPEHRYVLMVDFSDVIFCATLREMFYKYRSFGHSIVISAQRSNWPLAILGGHSPQTGTSFQYLNSGSIFATSQAWLSAWETMQARERQCGGKPPEIAEGRHIFNDDQAAWIDLYINRLSDIVLDGNCRLFQVLERVDSDVGTGNKDLLLEGRRIVNRETGGRPCLVHGAGNVPLTAWAKYILDAPPVWNWPLIERIRKTPVELLRNPSDVERLLCGLGLHEQTAAGLPDELLRYTGMGLSIWQWPNQFAQYLVWLANQPPIRSYVEIGVNEGGSFITTVEFLRRFHPLCAAIAVDPWISPRVHDYVVRTAGTRYVAADRLSQELRELVAVEGRIGLTLIDGEHFATGVRADWEFARSCTRYVAFHDIATNMFPDVRSLWSEIRATYKKTYEFVAQYPGPDSCAGIGVVDLAGGPGFEGGSRE
jgi:hypothetical protein